ncbi:MAG: terpene cyclase/mutase family protein [Planctomycetales bacterium]|nr:terpene cyclase/mutase family protein [Planctomycetales bacterium]
MLSESGKSSFTSRAVPSPPPVAPPVVSSDAKASALPASPPVPQLPPTAPPPIEQPKKSLETPGDTNPSAERRATLAGDTNPTAERRATWLTKRIRGWLGGGAMGELGAPATAGEYQAQYAEQRARLPAWLVSFTVHLVLILVLAAIPLARLTQGPLTVILGFSDTMGVAPFELSAVDSAVDAQPQQADFDSLDPLSDAGQLLKIDLPELVEFKPFDVMGAGSQLASRDIPYGIINGLKGRSGVLKEALLSKFGGTQDTEDAVALGLKWLAKQQRSNGSWSLVGPYGQGGANENATAATAMALNAFLGAGSTHMEGEYQDKVKLGLTYLVRKQGPDGYFPDKREPSRQQMYAQAIASIAVTEAYGMSGDEEMKIAAQRAMKFAAWSQSNRHGWRYNPREDADLSVTGWFVMALVTGKMAGLEIDESKLQNVSEFLDRVSSEDKSRYGYDGYDSPSLSMTAEGLLCRIYLGWPSSHPALLRAIQDDLLPNTPRLDDDNYSVYYWYYATQVLHHVGYPAWDKWNRDMRRVIPAMQEKSGVEAGSWPSNRDAFGAAGGRMYTTCLNLYCLEVYYRHLSIYDIH